MDDRVIIRDAKCIERDGLTELSAEVDGYRIWFRVPAGVEVSLRAEPFIAAGLFEAMARGVPLHVEPGLPLSPALLERLDEIQAVYRCWNNDLSIIKISAELAEEQANAGSVGSFYSAGVDSSHTLFRHFEDIDTLFFILGFDGNRSECDWAQRTAVQQQFAADIGKKLIVIQTNARIFSSERRIDWCFSHGPCLATIAPMLKFERVLIPSTHTYDELFPWGSHPLMDPMWSTGSNSIVHDAAGFRRSEKMRDLCADQMLLDQLQVCWHDSINNCGKCSKCVRTMLALRLLGASSKRLPKLDNMALLRGLKPVDESGLAFLDDAMVLAKEQGELKIYKQLNRLQRRYRMSQIIPLFDRLVLNGMIKKLYRRVRKPDWVVDRVSLRTRSRY